jgi:putative CocE/NonD family hydrolase
MPSRLAHTRLAYTLVPSLLGLIACGAGAQDSDAQAVRERFSKHEYRVPMRDGIELHTTIYAPTDTTRRYPFLMNRTPYSCGPYGEDRYPGQVHPSPYLVEDGYIFVCQDVRGRFMSDGLYDNMRPHVPGDGDIDESSDTYDTIEWLLANVPRHNGRVGQWGISYPGFYTAAALPEAHPALVASSPQAPIADFYFDDFHHHGAYTLAYWLITPLFGYQKDEPTAQAWWEWVRPATPDGYKYYMDLGPLKNSSQYFGEDNFFWQQLVEHPNYDAFWQARNILPHLQGVDHAVMTVGGWFDAEDLYGPLNIYRTIEHENPSAYNVLVMGPWSHGQWAARDSVASVAAVEFGQNISDFYQREVEAPFFRHFLKGKGSPPDFEAYVFDTGQKDWHAFPVWPPAAAEPVRLYLRDGEVVSRTAPVAEESAFTSWISDPNEPVPYTDEIRQVFTPRKYMAEDQRFAERRPDVIEFQTDVLEDDVTLAGGILARLTVSTTGEDADWIVKLIDVYPDATPNTPRTPDHIRLGGYQQMVRSEILRGRFRNSYEQPEPFVPEEPTAVDVPLQDVMHTFRAGHRIMVQVQSSWFPLFDRNPQSWVENIFLADEADFVATTHRLYHEPQRASYLEVKVLP